MEKKNPAEKREKKISCKAYRREKNILPTSLLGKKTNLLTRNHPPPPPPSRVKWSAPYCEKAIRLSRDIMLLAAIRKKFSSRNCGLRKSFSTVIIRIMLTTNLCRFSICFLHDRQQNGNVKRSEFVEFDGRKSNKCSRYRSIFRRSSMMLVLISVLT